MKHSNKDHHVISNILEINCEDNMEKSKSSKSIFRFCIIGGITTIIDFIIYWFLSQSIDISYAKICSMLCASIFSYFINKSWTFDNSDNRHGRYIWRFYITFIINIILNTSINKLAYYKTQNKIFAFIIATGCATIINYLLQNFWVFRKEGNKV